MLHEVIIYRQVAGEQFGSWAKKDRYHLKIVLGGPQNPQIIDIIEIGNHDRFLLVVFYHFLTILIARYRYILTSQ